MTTPAFYSQICTIYDLWISGDQAVETTSEFYLAEASCGTGTILEVGIGSGRIGVELARRGNIVVGIDSSLEMLELSLKRASDLRVESGRLRLVHGDILNLVMQEAASLAIMPLRTLGHFTSRADRLKLFASIFRLLRPGGAFLFDHFVFNPIVAKREALAPKQVASRVSPSGSVTVLTHSHRCNFEEQILECSLSIETVIDAESKFRNIPYRLAWVNPHEIFSLAAQAGFQNATLYGSFNREPFSSDSSDQVWRLTKGDGTDS